jgi:excisionase family DNA binding protein
MLIVAMSPRTYTTEEAAERAGISRATLQAWIAAKKFRPPKPTLDGARSKRLWDDSDVARLSSLKEKIYRKGRGRKKSGA